MSIYAVETAEQALSATKFMSEAYDRNPFRLIGLDTEFHGGGYPDSTLTHLTLSTEGYDFVFELTKPGVMAATESGWAQNWLHRITFATHFGQEDIMLLMRAGCRVDRIWDSGIISNHLGLINTSLKEMVIDYDLAVKEDYKPITSYAQLLRTILPLAEQQNYFKKNGDVMQSYPLDLAEGENRIKVLAYAAQDGGLTQALCHHLRDLVLPTIYDQHSLEIILTAQFEAAILLARNNSRGYNIDTKTLHALVSEIADEVGELDVTGRELVREAMGWDEQIQDENPLAAFLPKPKPQQMEMELPAGPRQPTPAILLGRSGATFITEPELPDAPISSEHDVHEPQYDRPEHNPIPLADAGQRGSILDRGRPEPAGRGADPEATAEANTREIG